jgi:drug/metabolite transporter (DMT)-like permease
MKLTGALLTVYVVWGSTYLAMKVGVTHLPPLTLNAVRFLVAGLALYAWCAWRRSREPGRGWRPPTVAQWRAGAVQGLLLPAAGTGGATWAEQKLPSGTTALLLATIPLWMVLGRRIADRERIGAAAALGLAAGIAGVALLVNPFSGTAPDPLATTVALAGAMCWGLGSVYGLHAPHPAQPLLAPAVEMLSAGVALSVLAAAGGEFGRLNPAGATHAAAALAYLIVFGSVVAYSAYQWLLRHASPRLAGTYAFVNPVVAVALGWWLLHERLDTRIVVASGVIAGGVALIALSAKRRPEPIVEPPDEKTSDANDDNAGVPGPRTDRNGGPGWGGCHSRGFGIGFGETGPATDGAGDEGVSGGRSGSGSRSNSETGSSGRG